MFDNTNSAGTGATAPETPVPWAQQAAKPQPRATSRSRRMVRGLPAWEPMPPGELLVRRHGRD